MRRPPLPETRSPERAVDGGAPEPLLRALLAKEGEDLDRDGGAPTEVLDAIETLEQGRWPADERACRWAMVAIIRRFRPELRDDPWPDGRASFDQLKPHFLKALRAKKLKALADSLKAAPAPVPSKDP